MNVKEFYAKTGGDYEGVFSRLMTDARIEKYLLKFAEGTDYNGLQESLAVQNYPDAFRFSHNLKGVSLNLGLTKMAAVSSELCEELRAGVAPKNDITGMVAAVSAEFEHICAEVKAAQQ